MKTLVMTIIMLTIIVSPLMASWNAGTGYTGTLQLTEDPNDGDPNEVPVPDEE